MTKELRNRLEEAANGIYPISEIYNDLDMEYVDTNSGLREAFKDGGEVGIEFGYKEAIAQVKEWLKENIFRNYKGNFEFIGDYTSSEELLKYFETDMNKLWEE